MFKDFYKDDMLHELSKVFVVYLDNEALQLIGPNGCCYLLEIVREYLEKIGISKYVEKLTYQFDTASVYVSNHKKILSLHSSDSSACADLVARRFKDGKIIDQVVYDKSKNICVEFKDIVYLSLIR